VSTVVMMVVLSAVVGILVAVLTVRWPSVDPADPHLSWPAVRRVVRRSPRLAGALQHRIETGAVTGVALALAVVMGIITAFGVGVLGLMIRTGTGLSRSDLPLAEWASRSATGAVTDVMRLVTLLGDGLVVLTLLVIVGIFVARRRPGWGAPSFLAVAVLGQFLIVSVAKWGIDRTRPDIEQLSGVVGQSFPSGHTTAAATAWACIAFLLSIGRPLPVRAALMGSAAAIATAVGVTRVVLGVHWFTDVVAGLVLGWGWFACCAIAFGGRTLHFGEPVEQAVRAARAVMPPRRRGAG
jgi:membrane-associated phospholipid phosphatase